MSGTTDEHKRKRVQFPGTQVGAAVIKRGRPRRILCDDTSNGPVAECPIRGMGFGFCLGLYGRTRATHVGLRDASQKRYCRDYLNGLRANRRGRRVDPLGKMRDPDFLEDFITRYAPGWNWLEWREKTDEREMRVK